MELAITDRGGVLWDHNMSFGNKRAGMFQLLRDGKPCSWSPITHITGLLLRLDARELHKQLIYWSLLSYIRGDVALFALDSGKPLLWLSSSSYHSNDHLSLS
jgi:hypothetical protein